MTRASEQLRQIIVLLGSKSSTSAERKVQHVTALLDAAVDILEELELEEPAFRQRWAEQEARE